MQSLQFQRRSEEEMMEASRIFYEELKQRRSVRDFSSEPIPRQVLEKCLMAAGTAPNGANLQPWTFVVVEDLEIKKQIRLAAEAEEREFYAGRANQEWLSDLAPLGTHAEKPFLEKAPVLIALFTQNWGLDVHGNRKQHYYVKESVGIACGFLIAALHHAGLATLTHTPSPMKFLSDILERPENEKPFLLLVTGYPSIDAKVPVIEKKKPEQFIIWK